MNNNYINHVPAELREHIATYVSYTNPGETTLQSTRNLMNLARVSKGWTRTIRTSKDSSVQDILQNKNILERESYLSQFQSSGKWYWKTSQTAKETTTAILRGNYNNCNKRDICHTFGMLMPQTDICGQPVALHHNKINYEMYPPRFWLMLVTPLVKHQDPEVRKFVINNIIPRLIYNHPKDSPKTRAALCALAGIQNTQNYKLIALICFVIVLLSIFTKTFIS